MLKYHMIHTLIACWLVLASGATALADYEYEDVVDITRANDKIYGVVESGRSFSLRIRSSETIEWSGSSGYLGAYLTNLRFLVLSNTSNGWNTEHLKLSESDTTSAYISPTIALLVTKSRGVAFDALSNRFVETQIPLRDDVISVNVGDEVAVIVTSSKVFGYGSGSSSFSQARLKLGESVEGVKISATKASVRTEDRLLTFLAKNATWLTTRLK